MNNSRKGNSQYDYLYRQRSKKLPQNKDLTTQKVIVKTITKVKYKNSITFLVLAFLWGWVFSLFLPIRVIENPLYNPIYTDKVNN